MSKQANSDIQELRALLFQQESARIERLEELLNNKELHAKEIAKVLAEAVRLRSKEDKKLGEALRPAVEDAITASITKNPKPLSDALFPVMGPAIRKAINHSLAAMLQSLNQTLEHSFSLKGLQWRLDAVRTGKSFAEIVMLNTLVYRVEQVFLIHKETGLLLNHLSFNPADNEDADVISSMLTAVRDFIQDSFAASSDQEAQSLRLGDLEIMVEQGPDTVLAVVCRGSAPRSLLNNISVVIEDIQHEFHELLQNFDGDTSWFESTDEQLSTLMISDYGKKQEQGKTSSATPLIVVATILTGLLTWWGWHAYQTHIHQSHWQSYIEAVRQQPGIVLTHVSEKNGNYTLTGLRDPLSDDPSTLLTQFELDNAHVHYQFQAYHALDSAIVLKRAIKKLQPPESITLSLQEDTLYIAGKAPKIWVKDVQTKALWIAGIDAVDTSKLDKPTVMPLMTRIKKQLQPPKTIQLQLTGTQLSVMGKATQAWVRRAAQAIHHISDITAYHDDQVIRIDSPQYLLVIAKNTLHPPASIHLSMGKDRILIAKGHASKQWLKGAQAKVASIAFIQGFQTKQVKLSDNIILQRAIQALQPPESVSLSFAKQTLYAEGVAPEAWIENAKKNALLVQGISHFATEKLHSDTSPWQKLNAKVKSIHFSAGHKKPTLSKQNKNMLQELASIYLDSFKLNPTSRLQILSPYDGNTKLVATMRLNHIIHTLEQLGISKAQIDGKLIYNKTMPTSFSLIKAEGGGA